MRDAGCIDWPRQEAGRGLGRVPKYLMSSFVSKKSGFIRAPRGRGAAGAAGAARPGPARMWAMGMAE